MNGVLIMGAPRTGTSFASKCMAAFGADFGQQCWSERKVDPRNQVLGYFEDEVFSEMLRIQIHGSGGYKTLMPPNPMLPLGMPVDQIREILGRDRQEPMGLKHTNIVAGFPWWWESVFSEWGKWDVVVTVRHPMDAAKSLEGMKHVPLSQGLALWHTFYTTLMAWDQMYGPFSWVEYPSAWGMEKAIRKVFDFSKGQRICLEADIRGLWEHDEGGLLFPSPHEPYVGPSLPAPFEYLGDMYLMLRERAYGASINHINTNVA